MKKQVKLSESDLHRIVNKSIKKVLMEGGQQYRFNSQNVASVEKKLRLYEKLVQTIKNAAERIIKIVDNSDDYDGSLVPALDTYDEHELYNFAEAILETIEQHFDGSGYDPTSYNINDNGV